MSSCYLTTVNDDLAHIMKAVGDNAQLSKWSGGLGNDWTNIRGTGALIKSTNVGSQGVVPFLKIVDATTAAINRSGKRRGATCVYLESWHYDIEDFLELRKNTGDERRRTHDTNTASWIPDLFMKRVLRTRTGRSSRPTRRRTCTTSTARRSRGATRSTSGWRTAAGYGSSGAFGRADLWRKMITMLFETGHPWITFKDPCNVRSPQDHVGVVHSSNLCTEITLNTSAEETAVCNLGSINLPRHVRGGRLDTALLARTVERAVRMLDNVIDLNFYPTPEARDSNLKHRPIGLGVMGLQDALYELELDFDSDDAVEFSDATQELISYHAILASSKLAAEKGVYGSYRGSKWQRGIFPADTVALLEEERGLPTGVDRRSRLNWEPVREHVALHGMRNSNCMAIAPTATIANIAGCFPSVEPIYKNIYVKSNFSGEFTIVNSRLVAELEAARAVERGIRREAQVPRREPPADRGDPGRVEVAIQGSLRDRSAVDRPPRGGAREMDRPEPVDQPVHDEHLGEVHLGDLQVRVGVGSEDDVLPEDPRGLGDREGDPRRDPETRGGRRRSGRGPAVDRAGRRACSRTRPARHASKDERCVGQVDGV